MIDTYFRKNQINIGSTAHDFFVIVHLFEQSKASGCAPIAWCWHKRTQEKSKFTLSNALSVR